MSSVLEDIRVRTIFKDQWMQEVDGTWYTHVPFDCTEADDVVVTLADSKDYIWLHKNVFEALGNGYTRKNECILTCGVKPDCDVQVMLEKAALMKGWLTPTPDGGFKWVPDEDQKKIII